MMSAPAEAKRITCAVCQGYLGTLVGTSGVYRITNRITGDFYIGSTKDAVRRWKEHRAAFRSNRHANRHIQNSWNKHGEDAFIFTLEEDACVDCLLPAEQSHLDRYAPSFNIAPEARCPGPRFRSIEHRRKIGAAVKAALAGRPGHLHTAESRQKISASNAGKVRTEAARLKMQERRIGVPLSESAKLKLSVYWVGRVFSDEHRKKLAAARLGQKFTDEQRQRMSEQRKGKPGRPISEETKEKIRAKAIGRTKSPETRAKIGAASRERRHSDETKRRIGESLRSGRYAK